MSMLGELLRERGWITEKQLNLALERQAQLGGKLGTCLLELGLVGEDVLLEVLADHLGTPAATADDLHEIPPDVVSLLPAKIALKAAAVPFSETASKVSVAMLHAGNLTLQGEISFVIGKRVDFFVATEVRITEALSKYYGKNLSPRFAGLARRLSSRRQIRQSPTNEPALVPASRAHRTRMQETANHREPTVVSSKTTAEARSLHSEIERIELTAEEQEMLSASRSAVERMPREEGPERLYLHRLAEAETSAAIGEALLQVLAADFVRILLFRVTGSRHEIIGWMAHGPELDRDLFLSYRTPVDQTAVFRQLSVTRRPFLGSLQEGSGHTELARCWGGSLEHDCLMLPVFVRDHLVSVVYADRISLRLSTADLDAARKVVSRAAIAFERCILQRKLRGD
jgi:hypothetical protein